MQIGLVDVDGHNFPNLALMKISAYHKAHGDYVEWANALFGKYDKLYMAKVFDFTADDITAYNAKEVIKGGTGYNLTSVLPDDIEQCFPDYGLYGITDTAYGYLTRGCPRGCPFCIVEKKEGKASRKVANLSDFWNGQKYIKLLDPNILACPDWKELFDQLIESKAWVDYTQGIDIRLMTGEKAEAISKTKVKMLHFAWDNADDTITPARLKEYRNSFGIKDSKRLTVYVLTNYNTTHEEDLYRIYKLVDMGYDPYVMIYDKANAPRKTRLLQRWCNNKIIFNVCAKFENYDCRLG